MSATSPSRGRAVITLRPLAPADAEAHVAAEDAEIVRWLSGRPSSVAEARAHFELLAANAAAGTGKRGFGIWTGGRLAGYADFDPDVRDGLDAGDVNLSYAVHPWARRRGVASAAVLALCELLVDQRIGTRAAIRVEPANSASVRVAQRCGFEHVREFTSGTDLDEHGHPHRLSLYVRPLARRR